VKPLRVIPPPYIQYLDEFFNSIELPYRQRLARIRQRIVLRYQEYENKHRLDTLEALHAQTWIASQKEALLYCYDGDTVDVSVPRDTLINRIHQLQPAVSKEKCQYCMLSEPKSIDHFLPKSIFPEFAVLPLNLFPCCQYCNSKKFTFWRRNGSRRIINFAIDNVEVARFLYCEIEYDPRGARVEFELRRHHSISPRLFGIIEGHFMRLGLFDRYKDAATGPISEAQSLLRNSFTGGFKFIRRSILLRHANSQEEVYGINFWRAAVFRALAESREFLRAD